MLADLERRVTILHTGLAIRKMRFDTLMRTRFAIQLGRDAKMPTDRVLARSADFRFRTVVGCPRLGDLQRLHLRHWLGRGFVTLHTLRHCNDGGQENYEKYEGTTRAEL